jgi:hypothetical protein
LALVLALGLLLLGCRPMSPRAAAAPAGDPRVTLGQPRATPREEANGAPVDCRVEITNQLSEPVSGLMLTCELLDPDGVSLGAGVTTLPDLRPNERRSARAVIYGVRRFASARAFVTVAGVQ